MDVSISGLSEIYAIVSYWGSLVEAIASLESETTVFF